MSYSSQPKACNLVLAGLERYPVWEKWRLSHEADQSYCHEYAGDVGLLSITKNPSLLQRPQEC